MKRKNRNDFSKKGRRRREKRITSLGKSVFTIFVNSTKILFRKFFLWTALENGDKRTLYKAPPHVQKDILSLPCFSFLKTSFRSCLPFRVLFFLALGDYSTISQQPRYSYVPSCPNFSFASFACS